MILKDKALGTYQIQYDGHQWVVQSRRKNKKTGEYYWEGTNFFVSLKSAVRKALILTMYKEYKGKDLPLVDFINDFETRIQGIFARLDIAA